MNISVVGIGYVGLVTAACLARVGHSVTCFDVDPAAVIAVNEGKVPFYEPGLGEVLLDALANGRLKGSADLDEAVADSEVTLIAVGTPSRGDGIELSNIERVSEQVGFALRNVPDYHVVAIKSTVVPGTTDTLVRGILEQASGRTIGEFGLCMNPEFLREGSAVKDFMEPDRIVIGGWDERSGRLLAQVYEPFNCPIVFTTLPEAELIKYASNSLLATLISFSNEIANLCEAIPDTDADRVMDTLHLDRRLSPILDGRRIRPGILSYLRAGAGFGGSCLPKDVNALRSYARSRGVTPSLLDAVMTVNSQRPERLVKLAEDALGSLHGRTLTILGLAFKPGTSDVRDSPAFAVIDQLLAKGGVVYAYDPEALAEAPLLVEHQVRIAETPESALSASDAAIICTAWPEFASWDWGALANIMRHPVIIDGRNILRNVTLPKEITYVSIGKHYDGVVEAAIVR